MRKFNSKCVLYSEICERNYLPHEILTAVESKAYWSGVDKRKKNTQENINFYGQMEMNIQKLKSRFNTFCSSLL